MKYATDRRIRVGVLGLLVVIASVFAVWTTTEPPTPSVVSQSQRVDAKTEIRANDQVARERFDPPEQGVTADTPDGRVSFRIRILSSDGNKPLPNAKAGRVHDTDSLRRGGSESPILPKEREFVFADSTGSLEVPVSLADSDRDYVYFLVWAPNHVGRLIPVSVLETHREVVLVRCAKIALTIDSTVPEDVVKTLRFRASPQPGPDARWTSGNSALLLNRDGSYSLATRVSHEIGNHESEYWVNPQLQYSCSVVSRQFRSHHFRCEAPWREQVVLTTYPRVVVTLSPEPTTPGSCFLWREGSPKVYQAPVLNGQAEIDGRAPASGEWRVGAWGHGWSSAKHGVVTLRAERSARSSHRVELSVRTVATTATVVVESAAGTPRWDLRRATVMQVEDPAKAERVTVAPRSTVGRCGVIVRGDRLLVNVAPCSFPVVLLLHDEPLNRYHSARIDAPGTICKIRRENAGAMSIESGPQIARQALDAYGDGTVLYLEQLVDTSRPGAPLWMPIKMMGSVDKAKRGSVFGGKAWTLAAARNTTYRVKVYGGGGHTTIHPPKSLQIAWGN